MYEERIISIIISEDNTSISLTVKCVSWQKKKSNKKIKINSTGNEGKTEGKKTLHISVFVHYNTSLCIHVFSL